MKLSRIAALFLLSLPFFAMPEAAFGSSAAYPTTDLNLRSGPSTRFPPVAVMQRGSSVSIHGCVKGYTWCDVSAGPYRGWASAAYLDLAYEGRYYRVPVYAERVDVPVITFEITSYWDTYYDDYDFYVERDRWYAYEWADDGPPPGWGDWDDDGVATTIVEDYGDGELLIVEEPAECYYEAEDGALIAVSDCTGDVIVPAN